MKQCIVYTLIFIATVCCRKSQFVPQTQPNSLGTNTKGGGGGSQPTALLSSIGGAFRLIGSNSDSIQINFSQPAPNGGWTVNLGSSDPAVQLQASIFVPAGSYFAHAPLTSMEISTSRNVTITARLGAESKSYVLKVFPMHYSFPIPQLQTPGNGSGFKNRLQVKFQWSNNVNAYYHDIQISDNITFLNPMLEVYLNDPIWAASYFNGLGIRYWRVRYIDGSGTPGPWSQVRNFEIKP